MPGEMKAECSVVLKDVWLFLDDELDPDARAAVQRHLDDCSPCLEEAGLDRKLKMLLHSKCGGDLAPAELRERLITRLSAITAITRADGSGSVTTVTAVTTAAALTTAPTVPSLPTGTLTTLDEGRIESGPVAGR